MKTTYQPQVQRITKRLEELQLEQSSLKGEIRQLEQQLVSYGTTPEDVNEFLAKKEKEKEKLEETLEELIEQVEEKLNEFES